MDNVTSAPVAGSPPQPVPPAAPPSEEGHRLEASEPANDSRLPPRDKTEADDMLRDARRQQKLDSVVDVQSADSFPASDPPSRTPITGH